MVALMRSHCTSFRLFFGPVSSCTHMYFRMCTLRVCCGLSTCVCHAKGHSDLVVVGHNGTHARSNPHPLCTHRDKTSGVPHGASRRRFLHSRTYAHVPSLVSPVALVHMRDVLLGLLHILFLVVPIEMVVFDGVCCVRCVEILWPNSVLVCGLRVGAYMLYVCMFVLYHEFVLTCGPKSSRGHHEPSSILMLKTACN